VTTRNGERARAWAALAAAAGLIVAYELGAARIPRGASEFAYAFRSFESFPFGAMRGFTVEQLASHLLRALLLGPALLLAAWALARLAPSFSLPRRISRGGLLAIAGASVVVAAWILAVQLGGRALVDDEPTYAYQAKLLAQGRLADPTAPSWVEEPFTVRSRLGATGKYLFGEPLVQVPGVLVGFPGLAHLALLGLTLWLWYRQLERQVSAEVAGWATALLAISPLLVITTGTGMSHSASLFCVALAGYGLSRLDGPRPWAGALLLGTALGFALTVRPQVALPAGAVLGAIGGWRLLRQRRWAALSLLLAAGGVWIGLVLAYDAALTGSPWRLPWNLVPIPEHYGFGRVFANMDYFHTPWNSVENLVSSAIRFNGWWLGWPGSLALVGVWWKLGRPRAALWPWLAVAAAIVAFHLPYYSPGVSDTGPVYYLELLLPASLLGAQALLAALARWRAFAAWALVVHCLLGTGSFFSEQAARLGRFVQLAHAPVERLLTQIDPPALLIYENVPYEMVIGGWLFSFPVRYRDERDPILTFPRSCPGCADDLRARYPGRSCWYFHIDPVRKAPDLRRCEAAERLLHRPVPPPGLPIDYEPTARRLGWLD